MALNRKNVLFAGHDEDTRARAHTAPLTETAKMNRVDPYPYLKATLKVIAAGHPVSNINELLPWACTPTSS